MTCNLIAETLAKLHYCEQTERGAKVSTTCLYASFDPVFVYVRKDGDGFVVSDSGEGFGSALASGASDSWLPRIFEKEADRFGLEFKAGVLSAKIGSADWLISAIVSVANASAICNHRAAEKERKTAEEDLAQVVFDKVRYYRPHAQVFRHFEVHGSSGSSYAIDVAAVSKTSRAFFEFVSPHRNSINSKFATFSDIGLSEYSRNFALHNKPLTSSDKALLERVAVIANTKSIDRLLESERYGVLH